ncbi:MULTISPECIES: hypothetical protein [Pseudomonas]|uniref:hypothetical protein n=1 Tax=Pseudomonas TaxID=286 RepID=UPI0018D713B1|nr:MULTISPECIES: hypothetical protein [Pseudomonas]MBH3361504.1 hypothetical protein [Pseudomonas sp. URMO17WK12:I11]MDH0620339.1 hypothetical protein [Pseudomonas fulva]
MIDERTGLEYTPSLRHFLAGLNIYDREETLGEELENYDITNERDREIVIRKYCVEDLEQCYNYKIRYLLWAHLKNALNDKSHDFASIFEDDPDDHSTLAFYEDEFGDPREFFSKIFEISSARWSADLARAQQENPTIW